METCHIHSPTLETNVRRVVLSHDPLSFQWMSRSRVASPAFPHWLFFAHLGCLKYFDVYVWHLSRKLYNKKDMVTLIVPCKKVHLNDSNLVRDIFIFILDAPAYCEALRFTSSCRQGVQVPRLFPWPFSNWLSIDLFTFSPADFPAITQIRSWWLSGQSGMIVCVWNALYPTVSAGMSSISLNTFYHCLWNFLTKPPCSIF